MPLTKRFQCPNGATVTLWHLTEEEAVCRALMALSPHEEAELSTRNTSLRRRQYLIARYLLSQLTGYPVEITYHPSGKPFLKESPLHISITHTADHIAVAIHPNQSVGIDIEQYGEKAYRIHTRFLSPEEIALLPTKNAETYSTLLWSAKESLYKALNPPTIEFRKEFISNLPPLQTKGELSILYQTERAKHIHTTHYYLLQPYILTLTTVPTPSK